MGNMKKNKEVVLSREDAARIRYLLEILQEYVKDVGPRELRGHEEETDRFIALLPEE